MLLPPSILSRVSRSSLLLFPLVLGAACGAAPPGEPQTTPGPAAHEASSLEAYWPRFHGPRGDNISDDEGLLRSWSEEGPPLAWTSEGIGYGYSSVAVADDMIYTAGNIGGSTVISALDMEGDLLWQVENGPAWTRSYEGTRGTPTIDEERLFHQSPLGQLTALDAKTGEQLWTRNVLEDSAGDVIQWALAESVLIDGERVISTPGGREASMVALDKRTGEVVWAAPPTGDQAGYASATLATVDGLRMIINMMSEGVIGVNADTGELLWRFEHVTSHDCNALKPIVHEDHVFVSSGYGSGSVMHRIDVDGQQATIEELWRSGDLDNHHGGIVLYEGHLYGSTHRGRWVCLDWETGETIYVERGVGKGSLTLADGMLYTLSERQVMGLVEATPEGHEVINSFRLPPGERGTSWAHPVVTGGRLYIRHGHRLFAYHLLP